MECTIAIGTLCGALSVLAGAMALQARAYARLNREMLAKLEATNEILRAIAKVAGAI